VAQKLAILKSHCDTLGRDYASIVKSTNINVFMLAPGEDAEVATRAVRTAYNGTVTPLEEYKKGIVVGTADVVEAKIESLLAAGADYIIGYLPRVAYEPHRVDQFAEVVKKYT
jgi:alkanesulfonate monooxygenase SsuD/methylene tetrahydromethanopterin reductase-like flavin-dependent oxidoreductase (luciferase family)